MGSEKGDIYSFGCLMYTMMYRKVPFMDYNMPTKDLLKKICDEGLQPRVPEVMPEEEKLVELMKECWGSDPDKRPKMRRLNEVVSTVFQES